MNKLSSSYGGSRLLHLGSAVALRAVALGVHISVRESVVYWYSFSNPRTMCIHCDNYLVILAGTASEVTQKKKLYIEKYLYTRYQHIGATNVVS